MIPKNDTIPLLQLASGDYLSIKVYKFSGVRPGKKVYLQANLHGNEIVGNAVIHELIEFLMTLEPGVLVGEIWLVPVCNPLATNQRSFEFATGRFNAYDGKDWNRIYWDYEKVCRNLDEFAQSQLNFETDLIKHNYKEKIKTAFGDLQSQIESPSSVQLTDKYRYKIQSLCLDADYLIDLHSNTNYGLEYLYYFRDREESAKLFLLEHGIMFDDYDGDAFDEAFMKPWLALENALSKLRKQIKFDVEAYTLELGTGMEMNPHSVSKGVRGVKNYLAQKGILNIESLPPEKLMQLNMSFRPLSQVKKYWSPVGGMVQSRVALGSSVQQGDLLYRVLSFDKSEEFPTVKNIHSDRDGLVFDVSINQSVNEGEFVLAIM
ncbi:MAG: succinylglutamate desuccinylase [Symploca sp. SIO2G7]|nr:succinylglutamate desuccinylase [Symploca sp. SIO2G7]